MYGIIFTYIYRKNQLNVLHFVDFLTLTVGFYIFQSHMDPIRNRIGLVGMFSLFPITRPDLRSLSASWRKQQGSESGGPIGELVDVSQKYGGFPPNHPIFYRVFHYKPSILGYHYLWKQPYDDSPLFVDGWLMGGWEVVDGFLIFQWIEWILQLFCFLQEIVDF